MDERNEAKTAFEASIGDLHTATARLHIVTTGIPIWREVELAALEWLRAWGTYNQTAKDALRHGVTLY